jgi:hypothetical protein
MNKNGQQVITTRALPDLIIRLYDRDQYLSHKAQKRHAMRVDRNLWRLCNILDWWNVHKSAPFDEPTLLYFVMLGEYIQGVYKLVYSGESYKSLEMAALDSFTAPEWWSHNRRWPMIYPKYIDTHMLANGWCPSDIQRLKSTLCSPGVFLASSLKSPHYRDARRSSPKLLSPTGSLSSCAMDTYSQYQSLPPNHKECSDFSCSAYQWKPEEYKTKHVFENCTCTHIEVDATDLARILDKGDIPIVLVENGIRITPAESTHGYVAISHVWSDGLGNLNANALPQCQVMRLACLVGNIHRYSEGPVAFWIDTLCCPVQPLDARANAIRLMRKTYQDAKKVLVLESCLESTMSSDFSGIEILLMIHCSKWNRRLWTLQEQILAGDWLYFQFYDMSIRLQDILISETLTQIPNPDDVLSADIKRLCAISTMFGTASGIFQAILGDYHLLNRSNMYATQRLSALQRMLPFRATSKPSDEAICLGHLFGLDVTSIVKAPDAMRMEAFWSALPEIPADVIFWIGPRLQTKPYRWAPSTFLTGRDMSNNRNIESAKLTEDGLLVHYPGWLLGCKRGRKIKAQFHMMDAGGVIYRVSCLDGISRQYADPDSALDMWKSEPDGTTVSALHLITHDDLDESKLDGAILCHDALLVVAYDIKEESLLVRFVCPATVRKLAAGTEVTQSWRDDGMELISRTELQVRTLGLWSSSPKVGPDSGIIDFMGCSAISESQAWYLD